MAHLPSLKASESEAEELEPFEAFDEVSQKNLTQDFQDLPFSYNETKLIVLVRDPEWAYAYWDFSGETWQWIQDFKHRDPKIAFKIRVHNIDQKSFWDCDVDVEAKNWYLNLGIPNTTFELELGFIDSYGRFHLIAKSNRIKTPRNGPSDKIDEQWMTDDFEELYRLSGGNQFASSSHLSALSSFSSRQR